jgi:hypothetical protein
MAQNRRSSAFVACFAAFGLVAALLATLWLRFGTPKPPPVAQGSPLTIQVDPPASGSGCLDAGIMPVRMTRSGSEIAFALAANDQPASIAWPNGFSGRLVDGKAQLVSPDGRVIAVEGDILSNLGGAAIYGVFHVCEIGSSQY